MSRLAEVLSLCVLCILFFVFASLHFITKKNIYPLINGLIVLFSIFLYRGKYRLYVLSFYIPLSKAMTINSLGIGSFLTWCCLIYLITCIIERLIKGEEFNYKEIVVFLSYLLFSIYIFVIDLINIADVSIKQYIGVFAYWSMLFAFLIDKRAEKSIFVLVLVFCFSQIFTNLFCVVFIYGFHQYTIPFLETYIPNYVESFKNVGISSFRYPGLIGDSNHNGYQILFAVSLIILYLYKYKNNIWILALMLLLLLPFGFLGGSKTFFITLIILLAFSVIMVPIRSQYKFYFLISASTIFLLAFTVFLSSPTLSKVILRFINIDMRVGVLDSLTTSRASIWTNYFSEFINDPLKFMTGHGARAAHLFNKDYHSAYIQALWEFGLIGTLLYCLYFGRFLINRTNIRNMITLLPLILILFFGVTLHIIYEEGTFAGIFIYYLIANDPDSISRVVVKTRRFQVYEIFI